MAEHEFSGAASNGRELITESSTPCREMPPDTRCPDTLGAMAIPFDPDDHPDFLKQARYVDWSRFSDGRMWELRRGDDFDEEQSCTQARKAFNSWAYRRGLKTHTRIVDDRVLRVQVVER